MIVSASTAAVIVTLVIVIILGVLMRFQSLGGLDENFFVFLLELVLLLFSRAVLVADII